MKYVVVCGGVVSGLGKGITISSIGRLLKQSGLRVTSIKIDPYLNVDAGTVSPFEHGEVFVLNDGGEVRQEQMDPTPLLCVWGGPALARPIPHRPSEGARGP